MQIGWKIVRDFMEVLAQEGRRNALYRGQACQDWGLVPSLYRPSSFGINHPHHLREWKKRASRFASPLPRDDVDWLILAQHYGLATSLLDWTTSPLVALLFACDDIQNLEASGCVWWVMGSDFAEPYDTLMIDVFAEERERPIRINGVGRNVRSTAQDSILTLHTRIDYNTLGTRRIFSVAAEDKAETLNALEKLGFTSERLHFDITKLVCRFKSELAGRRGTV